LSVLIFFHNDNDGRCAGAIAYREIKPRCDDDIICYEMDYGRKLPSTLPEKIDKLFVLDYSFNTKEWNYLIEKYGRDKIVWIDHHISSIIKYDEFSDLAGIRTEKWSGAMLTWKYFHPKTGNIIPRVVELVDDYDRWQMKYGEVTLDFYEYSLGYDLSDVKSEIWTNLLNADSTSIDIWSQIGKRDRSRRINEIKHTISEQGIPIVINWQDKDYTCMIINSSDVKSTSQIGEIIYNDLGYDLAWIYYDKASENGDFIRVHQLRSVKINVSEIATKYKGGGHPNAAGFIEIIQKKDVYNCKRML
jgi:oligoribonuclease NrnB/cAMP/cGMP phosphodiesterase (DHH superfamily)